MSLDNVTSNPYPRIVAVEVWNFMSIEHGRVEFDEKNIINLKGYNDSGKSAMLTAMRVALLNSNPTKQASFIQDDKEYFRVVVYFEDGVQLLRDKYINGQSLIEMHKNGQCIFTTKSGNALTRITDIPQPVADYLGLVTFDGGSLNARSCFEKQLGVQTTGAENYKMFNTVLKSEEIATASTLLNNDKNKLESDIGALDREIQAQKTLLGAGDSITDDMIVYLKQHDAQLDSLTVEEGMLNSAKATKEEADAVVIYPEVESVDDSQLKTLETISGVLSSLSEVRIHPEVQGVDGSQLAVLSQIKSVCDMLEQERVTPEVPSVADEQIKMLMGIANTYSECAQCVENLEETAKLIDEASSELERLQIEAENHGSKFVRCPNCGELFTAESGHTHA